MVSFRYPYNWTYQATTGGGTDTDGNPIEATVVDTPFNCDAQADGGSYTARINEDDFSSKFFISIPTDSTVIFKKGQFVKSPEGEDFRVIRFIVTNLARELWVG